MTSPADRVDAVETPPDRTLSNRVLTTAMVLQIVSNLLHITGIRLESPGWRTAGLVVFVVSIVVFAVALGVRFIGKR